MKSYLKGFIKSIFLAIILCVIGMNLQQIAVAQESFDDAYQGYLKTYDAYRDSHTNYLSARNQYLQFGTLNSRNDALTAVKNFMLARDLVLQGYISLLRIKNVNSTYVPQLDEQFNFLELHKQQIPPLATLEDATDVSAQIANRQGFLQATAQGVMASLIHSRIDNFKLRLILLENEASAMINNLRNQNKDVSTLDRWLLDARGKRLLAEEKISQSQLTIQYGGGEVFTTTKVLLYQANQYIREALSYHNELSELIKYGNY